VEGQESECVEVLINAMGGVNLGKVRSKGVRGIDRIDGYNAG